MHCGAHLPPCSQSVGRNNICFDTFLTSSRFSDAVFMGAPGDDRFVLENVDGFAWQLRLRSRVRWQGSRGGGLLAGGRVHLLLLLLQWSAVKWGKESSSHAFRPFRRCMRTLPIDP